MEHTSITTEIGDRASSSSVARSANPESRLCIDLCNQRHPGSVPGHPVFAALRIANRESCATCFLYRP